MTPEEVKKYYKTSYMFNKKTGMSHSSLNNWLKWGFVPTDSQIKIQELTGGVLKVSHDVLERQGMIDLQIKWPKVVSEEPLINWINLCNGTFFRMISFFSSAPKCGLFVGIEKIGCYIFAGETYKSGEHVGEKLNLNSMDACIIADWINAQFEVKDCRQQGKYFLNYLDKTEPYSIGAEAVQMPLIPEIISD